MKNGFTLIELIIVLTIMTVLGAIAVPNFLSTSTKTRLKADIQSAHVINDAKDLYENETGKTADGSADSIIQKLCEEKYLKQNYKTQTNGATWVLDTGVIKVDITKCDEGKTDKPIESLYNNLSENEKYYVKSSGSSSGS